MNSIGNHIKAITFDFWNTLFQMDAVELLKRRDIRIDLITRFLRKQDCTRTREQVDSSYKRMTERWENSWLKGAVASTPEGRITEILTDLGYERRNAAFRRMVVTLEEVTNMHYPPIPVPGALETVRELSRRYALGIISDTGMTPGRILRKLMEQNHMLEYFSCFSFSDEVGYYKPDSRIFLHALECLGVSPQESFHIGDITHTDIKGAKIVGMGAILMWNEDTDSLDQEKPDMCFRSYGGVLDFFR